MDYGILLLGDNGKSKRVYIENLKYIFNCHCCLNTVFGCKTYYCCLLSIYIKLFFSKQENFISN